MVARAAGLTARTERRVVENFMTLCPDAERLEKFFCKFHLVPQASGVMFLYMT
jgi:hypothetical protein